MNGQTPSVNGQTAFSPNLFFSFCQAEDDLHTSLSLLAAGGLNDVLGLEQSTGVHTHTHARTQSGQSKRVGALSGHARAKQLAFVCESEQGRGTLSSPRGARLR